jgi:hypothetical protein
MESLVSGGDIQIERGGSLFLAPVVRVRVVRLSQTVGHEQTAVPSRLLGVVHQHLVNALGAVGDDKLLVVLGDRLDGDEFPVVTHGEIPRDSKEAHADQRGLVLQQLETVAEDVSRVDNDVSAVGGLCECDGLFETLDLAEIRSRNGRELLFHFRFGLAACCHFGIPICDEFADMGKLRGTVYLVNTERRGSRAVSVDHPSRSGADCPRPSMLRRWSDGVYGPEQDQLRCERTREGNTEMTTPGNPQDNPQSNPQQNPPQNPPAQHTAPPQQQPTPAPPQHSAPGAPVQNFGDVLTTLNALPEKIVNAIREATQPAQAPQQPQTNPQQQTQKTEPQGGAQGSGDPQQPAKHEPPQRKSFSEWWFSG